MGQLYAAEIFAARAGIDHPVNRDISGARVEEFNMLFRRSLSPKLQASLDDLIGGTYQPEPCDIEVVIARYRWIATLPAADAADFLALQFSGQLGPSLTMVALP